MTDEPRTGPEDEAAAHAVRRELPASIEGLEPMGAAFDEALEAGLAELGLVGSLAAGRGARRSYEAHARLLRAWGTAINLTAVLDPAGIARRHVCDALSALRVLEDRLAAGATLLDLGSGAGYPGLPLAAASALGHIGLLDSVGKKARFLRVAAAAVEAVLVEEGGAPPRIDVIGERAEDVAEEPDGRDAWDVVTARAVGSLSEVVELAMPLLRDGGLLVAWKREAEHDGLSGELREAGPIIQTTGGGRPEVVGVETPSLPGHRLVLVPKLRATPSSYPRPVPLRRAGRRRSGMPC